MSVVTVTVLIKIGSFGGSPRKEPVIKNALPSFCSACLAETSAEIAIGNKMMAPLLVATGTRGGGEPRDSFSTDENENENENTAGKSRLA